MNKLLLVFALLTTAWAAHSQSVIYFTPAGAGVQDGSSWGNASSGATLRQTLRNTDPTHQIWVAAGTYVPSPTSRDSSFFIHSDLKVYGGFAGNETSLSQRSWQTHVTTLSGDIGVLNDTSDNSIHVVYFENAGDSTLLDGFTITGGNADGGYSGDPHLGYGGGVLNYSNADPGLTGISNPRIFNCTFKKNYAFLGGGAYSDFAFGLANSKFYNCTFDSNASHNYGNVYASSNFTTPIGTRFDSCRFINNIMDTSSVPLNAQGGVFFSTADKLTINKCYFENNAARNGGVLDVEGRNTSVFITNCTFKANYSAQAAAVILATKSNLHISNCTFDSNHSPFSSISISNGIYNEAAIYTHTYLYNCAFKNERSYYPLDITTSSNLPGNRATDSTNITNCLFANCGQYGVIRSASIGASTENCFFTNVTLYDDSAHVYQKGGPSSAQITAVGQSGGTNHTFINNSIIWFPSGVSSGNSILNFINNSGNNGIAVATTTISNSIIRMNTVLYNQFPWSNITDGGNNMINQDPMFISSTTGNYRLDCGSPAVNTGSMANYPTSLTTDLDGNARVSGSNIDRGCYEQTLIPTPNAGYVFNTNSSQPLSYIFTYTGSASDSVRWTINGLPVAGSDTLHYTFPAYGNYDVCVIATNHCSGADTFCSQIVVGNTTSIAVTNSLDNIIDVFPVPALREINLKVKETAMLPLEAKLIDMFGNVVVSQLINQPETTFNMSKLASGNYFLRINKDGHSRTVRVVKL